MRGWEKEARDMRELALPLCGVSGGKTARMCAEMSNAMLKVSKMSAREAEQLKQFLDRKMEQITWRMKRR
jgi:hypothetical protein